MQDKYHNLNLCLTTRGKRGCVLWRCFLFILWFLNILIVSSKTRCTFVLIAVTKHPPPFTALSSYLTFNSMAYCFMESNAILVSKIFWKKIIFHLKTRGFIFIWLVWTGSFMKRKKLLVFLGAWSLRPDCSRDLLQVTTGVLLAWLDLCQLFHS